jgi:uncharacterized OB-fold protein
MIMASMNMEGMSMQGTKVKKHELVVKKWYETLDEGKILSTKCRRCGTYEFPPLYCCNNCSGSDVEWAEISGEGKLLEFTLPGVATSNPEYAHLMPYGVGVVELKEGTSIIAVVRGISKENWQEISSKLPVPVSAEIVQGKNNKNVAFRIRE